MTTDCPLSGPEGIAMLSRIVTRRAAEVRDLVDRGAFIKAHVLLRNGGTLPAEIFAKVALDDLAYLTGLDPSGVVESLCWERLAGAIELLHEVALARGYASAEQIRFPA
jgi:hypothetical protein